MKNIAIVYWSGTGNTEAMAQTARDAVEAAGATPTVFDASSFDASKLDSFDAVMFGCPAMGDEELEPDEFEPMFAGCEGSLDGRTVALFGSYEWNDGAWMDTWRERTAQDGARIIGTVVAYGYPDDAANAELRGLAADVVAATQA